MTALISRMRQDSALDTFVNFTVFQMAHMWIPQASVARRLGVSPYMTRQDNSPRSS